MDKNAIITNPERGRLARNVAGKMPALREFFLETL
jgi:hypothetical protein